MTKKLLIEKQRARCDAYAKEMEKLRKRRRFNLSDKILVICTTIGLIIVGIAQYFIQNREGF